jgi:hypothetical protein
MLNGIQEDKSFRINSDGGYPREYGGLGDYNVSDSYNFVLPPLITAKSLRKQAIGHGANLKK